MKKSRCKIMARFLALTNNLTQPSCLAVRNLIKTISEYLSVNQMPLLIKCSSLIQFNLVNGGVSIFITISFSYVKYLP